MPDKKNLLIIVSVILILILSTAYSFNSALKNMADLSADEETVKEANVSSDDLYWDISSDLIATRTPSSNTAMSSIYCLVNKETNPEKIYISAIQGSENIYYYFFLPAFGDFSETRLMFGNYSTDISHITITDINGNAVDIHNGDTISFAADASMYTAEFYDNNNEIFDSGLLFFKKANGNSSIFIDTTSGSMDNVHSDKSVKESGKISIFNESGHSELSSKLDYIKGHGNSTWKRWKKPYQIKLSSAADILGMGSADKWILQSNVYDASAIRNSLVFSLAEKVGLKYTPEQRRCELYLNGRYAGLYQISEKVEISEERVNIKDLDSANKEVNSYSSPVNNPGDISGGYLLEHDFAERLTSGESYFRTEGEDGYVICSPKYTTDDESEYISNIFQQVEDAVWSGDENLSKLIDMKSFADKYILDELVMNDDAGITSAYYYKDSDINSSLLYAGPVWDYDHCLGKHANRLIGYPDTLNFWTGNYRNSTKLFFGLYTCHPEFLELIKSEWTDNFLPAINEMLESGIAELSAEVALDNGMNEILINESADTVSTDTETVSSLLSYRRDVLSKVWQYDAPLHIVYFYEEDGRDATEVGVPDGNEIGWLPWGNEEENTDNANDELEDEGSTDDDAETGDDEEEFEGWYDMDTGEAVTQHTIVTRDMRVKEKTDD
ncbi:CotH kinase family protein [Lachnospiraceae bacterium C1.1]|nr:CotH kinase family protein [Lachnospiraceae bacterium C1.1]